VLDLCSVHGVHILTLLVLLIPSATVLRVLFASLDAPQLGLKKRKITVALFIVVAIRRDLEHFVSQCTSSTTTPSITVY
jgi:hypothetical protein